MAFNGRGTRTEGHDISWHFACSNLANNGAPTSFRTTTVNYREVTELLAPLIFRIGLRWDF